MPLQRCKKDNKPGWKWGKQGFCYTYDPKSVGSEMRARNEANKQAAAIIIKRGKKK